MPFLSETDFLFYFIFIELKNIITSVFWWHYIDPPFKVTAVLPTIVFGKSMLLDYEHYKYFPLMWGRVASLGWVLGIFLTPG